MNLEQRINPRTPDAHLLIDYDREMALVAERRNPETASPKSWQWAA